MANTFKLTTNAGLTTSLVDQYTTPGSTTTIIVGMSVANTSANSITVDAKIISSTSDNRRTGANESTYLVKGAPVPSGSSLEIMSGNKLVLETGDKVQALASTTGVADILISYMEIT
jgi:hypothetical protein